MSTRTTLHSSQAPTGTKALLFAAGLGTRLRPFTDEHPKALAPVNGKTLLQRNIEYLKAFGIFDIIINVHHFADQIIDFLEQHNNFGCRISISHEIEQALETGGGLKYASWFFKDQSLPFLVMNVDILTDLDLGKMLQDHLVHRPMATLAVTDRISSRRLLFDEENILCGWTNQSTGETILPRNGQGQLMPRSFSCVHLIEPQLLRILPGDGKFSIINSYLELAKDQIIRGYRHDSDLVFDVGKSEAILEAEKYFK